MAAQLKEEFSEKTPTDTFVPTLHECDCPPCNKSKKLWQIGNSFEAVSFGVRHLATEEVHAAITLYDNKVFHSILKHLLKTKGVL